MPKFDLEDEKVVDVVATNAVTEVVPENVVELSSGVKVQFIKPLSPFTAQQIVILSFNNINVDAQGRVKNNMTSQEQLATAKKMYDFNSALIINGLAEGALKVYGGLPKDNRWLTIMKINPAIASNHPFIDFNDQLHLDFLYLFYTGFINEDDYALLSKHLLGQ